MKQVDSVFEFELEFNGNFNEQTLKIEVPKQLIKAYDIFENSLLIYALHNMKQWEGVTAHRFTKYLNEIIQPLEFT